MSVEQLKLVRSARPFRPFTIHMGDGRSFRVEHPEFLARSPSGRSIIVYHLDESFSILDRVLLTDIEVDAAAGEAAQQQAFI